MYIIMGTTQSKFSKNLEILPKNSEIELASISSYKYNNPRRRDVAVCFVYFNPAKSSRMLMNYLYTIEKLDLVRIPHYTLELYYSAPEIKNAFHLKAESYLFHKERLCFLLEKRVPFYYRKLLFLDADIIFNNPDWYSDLSRALDSYDAVQPFTTCTWLDITLKKQLQTRRSVAFMPRNSKYEGLLHHPGFGWGFRRSWFNKVGFFQYGITGSGDTLSSAAWLGTTFAKGYLKPALVASYAEYCKKERPRLTCIDGNVFHLWHGGKEGRKYIERHSILDGVIDVRVILRSDKQGVFTLLDGTINELMKKYFESRDDDGF